MQNERKRILAMLENGTISTDEALTLLEKLGDSKQAEKMDSSQQETFTESEPKVEVFDNEKTFGEKDHESKRNRSGQPSMDDFLEDLRKDFTHVGDRFVQFMQTAVQKVKAFDFDSPFGSGVAFTHTMVKNADELKNSLSILITEK